MASLTIRNIDDLLKADLRVSAAMHGHSMEEEARQILKRALMRERSSIGLGSRISQRFAAVGGFEAPVIERTLPRPAPDLEGGERE